MKDESQMSDLINMLESAFINYKLSNRRENQLLLKEEYRQTPLPEGYAIWVGKNVFNFGLAGELEKITYSDMGIAFE